MRTNTITLIVGGRGTGKTTFIRGSKIDRLTGVIDVYLRKQSGKKILVVDMFNNPVWAEIPVIEPFMLKAWKRGVYRIYSNDFEDATKYIGAKLNRYMYRFLIDSKQKNLDVFFVFHSLAVCPLDLIRISNFVVLFKTNEVMNPHLRTKFPFPEIPSAFEPVVEPEVFYGALRNRLREKRQNPQTESAGMAVPTSGCGNVAQTKRKERYIFAAKYFND